MEKIITGNDFRLIVDAQKMENRASRFDLNQLERCEIYLVKAGRARILQSYTLDDVGRAIIDVDGDALTTGTWGVEIVGTYLMASVRSTNAKAFQIVDGLNNGGGDGLEITVEVLILSNSEATRPYVDYAIAEHDADTAAHPTLQAAIDDKVADVKINGTSVVDDGKVANVTMPTKVSDFDNDSEYTTKTYVDAQVSAAGRVDDVEVNGTSVLDGKTAKITMPTKTSDLSNDSDFQSATQVQQAVDDAIAENLITGANVSIDSNTGTPSATVTKNGNSLDFAFHNMKGDKGEQGVKGDTVILGSGTNYTLYNVMGDNTDGAMTQKAATDELKKTNVVLYGEDDPTFSITKGYYNLNSGTVRGFANLNTRVKINTAETLLKGSYHLKLNDGYVIRQILICDANNENGSELVSSSQLLTEYTFIPSDDNVIYSAITICKTNASSSISTDEDIIDVLEHPNQGLIHEVEVLEEKINEIPTIYRSIKKAVFMGDSITHGVYSYFNGGVVDDANRYNGFDINNLNSVTEATNYHGIPYYFAKYAGCEYVNLGKRGSGYVYDGRDIGNALEVAENYDFSDVDFVALCFGINDWIQGVIIGDINTLESGTLMGNMAAVLAKIFTDNPLCKVVVYSPYNSWGQYSNGGDYTSHTTYGSESTNYALGYNIRNKGTLQDYVDAIDAVCQHYGVQHVALSKSNVVNRFTIKNIMIDGLHPSKASYPMLAAEIYGKGNYGV